MHLIIRKVVLPKADQGKVPVKVGQGKVGRACEGQAKVDRDKGEVPVKVKADRDKDVVQDRDKGYPVQVKAMVLVEVVAQVGRGKVVKAKECEVKVGAKDKDVVKVEQDNADPVKQCEAKAADNQVTF